MPDAGVVSGPDRADDDGRGTRTRWILVGSAARGVSANDAGRVARFADRHRVRGLGIVGPISPAGRASVVGSLPLGLDRRLRGRCMSIGIIVMHGLFALAVAVLAAPL